MARELVGISGAAVSIAVTAAIFCSSVYLRTAGLARVARVRVLVCGRLPLSVCLMFSILSCSTLLEHKPTLCPIPYIGLSTLLTVCQDRSILIYIERGQKHTLKENEND